MTKIEKFDYGHGFFYEGEVKDGIPHNEGIFTLNDGTKIRGKWIGKDLKDDYGEINYPSKIKYAGDIKKWIPNGFGVMWFPSGSRYEGCFKDGKAHGGEFIDGKFTEDIGIYYYAEGEIYAGCFRKGLRHGYGVMKYNDNSKYEGYWFDDFEHGKGIQTYADGTKQEGLWHEGEYVDVDESKKN